jgi:sirohydrochlorin cobaltochelatase
MTSARDPLPDAGLLLVGHGSHFNAMSSAPVHEHARRLRECGGYAEVRVAFWKEEPALCRGLDAFDAERIVVVPVFMSSGYFVEEVIPREMRLDGPGCNDVDGKRVVYTDPVGSHPLLAEVIVERAAQAGGGGGCETLVVLGHGTPRSSHSEKNIYAQADRVNSLGVYPNVVTLFLDQEPNLQDVWRVTKSDRIVVVPLFVADGWHVGETIPADLDLAGGENRKAGRRLHFAAAVGTHPRVANVIDALASEAAIRLQAR